MMRLTLTLQPEEAGALRQVSRRECRRPRDQARYLLRQALGLAIEANPGQPTGGGMQDRAAMESDTQRAAV